MTDPSTTNSLLTDHDPTTPGGRPAAEPEGRGGAPPGTARGGGLRKRAGRTSLGAQRRMRMLARLWDAAEGQLGEIESRIGALDAAGVNFEREARTLAILARVVRDLSAEVADPRGTGRGRGIRRRKGGPGGGVDPAEGTDDQPHRNLDQLRDDLARHLQRLRDGGGAEGPPGRLQR